ncbi:hypothetical protein [Spirosoma pomorum]
MKWTTKLLLGLAALLAIVALYQYYVRRTVVAKQAAAPDTSSLANMTAMQATQISALTSQVQSLATQQPVIVSAGGSPQTTSGQAPDTFIQSIKTQLTN